MFDFPSLDERHAQVTVAFGLKEVLSLFYIGEDRIVHRATFSDGHWEYPTVKIASFWPPPLADKANADISVAYDYRSNRMWLYYMRNGSLTQVYKPEQDIWHAAIALPKVGPANETEHGGGPGLSRGAKMGMGIGVGLGAALLVTAIAAYIFVHLRRSRQKREGKEVADQGTNAGATSQSPPSHPGSPAPQYTSRYCPTVSGFPMLMDRPVPSPHSLTETSPRSDGLKTRAISATTVPSRIRYSRCRTPTSPRR